MTEVAVTTQGCTSSEGKYRFSQVCAPLRLPQGQSPGKVEVDAWRRIKIHFPAMAEISPFGPVLSETF